MTVSARRRDQPVSMRLPQSDLALIDRAAGLSGRSRTDFVRDAAVRAAEETLLERHLIRMSPDGFDAFLAILAEPAAPVAEMVEALRRPAPWEGGSGR